MGFGLGHGFPMTRPAAGGGPPEQNIGWNRNAVNGPITVSTDSLTGSATTNGGIGQSGVPRTRSIASHWFGKYALRVRATLAGVIANDELYIGLVDAVTPLNVFPADVGIYSFIVNGAGDVLKELATVATVDECDNADWRCFLVDFDAGKAWVGINGVFSGDPEAGTSPTFTFPIFTLFYALLHIEPFAGGPTSGEIDIAWSSGSFSAWGSSTEVNEPALVTWDIESPSDPAMTLSNGDLTANVSSDAFNYFVRANKSHNSGKRTFTVTLTGTQPGEDGQEDAGVLLMTEDSFLYNAESGNLHSRKFWLALNSGALYRPGVSGTADLGFYVDSTQKFRVWVDFDAGKFWIGNPALELAGDPETGSSPSGTFVPGTRLFPGAMLYSFDGVSPVSATIEGTETSGSYAAWND